MNEMIAFNTIFPIVTATVVGVYSVEKEIIWFEHWVYVGRAETVAAPGQFLTVDVVGESILVTRNKDDALRAFYNVCSHRGSRLCEEREGTTKAVFQCPYHAWTYDLDGQLIGTPNVKEDEYFDRSEYPLHQVHVGSYAGFIFVNMSPEPSRTLMEALTQGAETITAFERFKMDELRIGVRLVYEVEANWKIIVENYNECLHCPGVHPELNALSNYMSGEEMEGDGAWCGGSMTLTGDGAATMGSRPLQEGSKFSTPSMCGEARRAPSRS
jgi:Rieske 2Fe-2S family protein